MTRFEPPQPTPATGELGGFYAGYRWPGRSTLLRLPYGGYEQLGAHAGAGVRLAEAVLRDRFGHAPCRYLLCAFLTEWVRPFTRGEFAWPVDAVDEWLAVATLAALTAGAEGPCAEEPRDRARQLSRRVLRTPDAPRLLFPITPLSPGAH